jgi:hypothetical protein
VQYDENEADDDEVLSNELVRSNLLLLVVSVDLVMLIEFNKFNMRKKKSCRSVLMRVKNVLFMRIVLSLRVS